MRRLFILIAVLALAVTACRIESNTDATLNADGSGTVAFEIGLDDEARELLLQDTDPFEDAPDGSDTTTEERGDMTYYIASVPFATPEELARLMTEEENSIFSTFTATFTESSVTVQGTTEDSGGGFLGEGELEGFDPGLIEESVSASVRITMPGRVLDSNADSAEGSTLTWEVPLLGGAVEVRAESDPTQSGGGGGGFPIWIVAVIVLVLGGGIAYFVLNQRRAIRAGGPVGVQTHGGDAAPPPPPPPPVE
jgi:hypothetical protein